MDKLVGYCGLICTDCPGYIATQKNDMDGLKKVAELWSKEHGGSLTAHDCICDGCTVEGRKIGHCSQCKVRLCAMERGVASCAHCADFGCQTISEFLSLVPQAKANLEGIRRTLSW